MEFDFLAQFPAKTAEYLIALSYLALFAAFWRFMSKAPATQEATADNRRTAAADFTVPDGIQLHPGHAWLRMDTEACATVGVDDFAQKLLGPITRVELPQKGTVLLQGEPAWHLRVGDKRVPMLSPVDGMVTEVNAELSRVPEALSDPYGEGWLVKVKPTRPEADTHQLLRGATAKRYVQDAFESLLRRASPDLGAVAHDGGVPIHGFARAVDPEQWDAIAREHFLTGDAP